MSRFDQLSLNSSTVNGFEVGTVGSADCGIGARGGAAEGVDSIGSAEVRGDSGIMGLLKTMVGGGYQDANDETNRDESIRDGHSCNRHPASEKRGIAFHLGERDVAEDDRKNPRDEAHVGYKAAKGRH